MTQNVRLDLIPQVTDGVDLGSKGHSGDWAENGPEGGKTGSWGASLGSDRTDWERCCPPLR